MNAADLYRKAFVCLPEGELDAYYRRLGSDDQETDRFVERGSESLDLLQRAAECTECDWGDDAAAGVPIEDFSGARRLAVLSLVRAEGSFRRGDDRAGLNDLVAVMAMGRQLGRGKYISGLAGIPIEDLAVTKAFEVLGRVDSASCRAFADRLNSLPGSLDVSAVLRAEQTYFRGAYRDKFATLDDGDVARRIREEFGLPARTEENAGMTEFVFPAGDPAERMLLASGGTRAGLLALADEVLAAFDTLVEITKGGEAASEKLTELRSAALSNPMLADELRTFDKMRPLWDRFSGRFASLRAAVVAKLSDADAPDSEPP